MVIKAYSGVLIMGFKKVGEMSMICYVAATGYDPTVNKRLLMK